VYSREWRWGIKRRRVEERSYRVEGVAGR